MGHCEQDEHAERSYRALFDTRGEWFCDDIRKADAGSMPDFELLCGGFPCQSFSIAGSRHGFADPRGTLFFELARVAEARKPPYLLFENVPGLGYKMAYPGDSIDLAYPQMNTRRGRVGRQIAHTLTTDATQGTLEPRPVRTPLVSSPERNPSRTGKPGAPMFTLTTKDRHGVLLGKRIRRLTPRECLRLQGWRDEQIDRVLAIQSDNQVYKQAGNGVTVTVVEAIGRRLAAVHNELEAMDKA